MSPPPPVNTPRPFSKAVSPGMLLFILAASCLPASATVVYTFEDLPDSYFYSSGNQNIGTYYAGITFGPDVTGLSVSRFGGYDSSGFPPESGDVVIWDATDATITISFATPLDFFGIWYTTYDPLTLQAFDSGSNLLDTAVGNPNTDGTTGTTSFLSLSDPGISSVTLTSTPGYFTLDDMTIDPASGAIPEPSSWSLLALGLSILYSVDLRRRHLQESPAPLPTNARQQISSNDPAQATEARRGFRRDRSLDDAPQR